MEMTELDPDPGEILQTEEDPPDSAHVPVVAVAVEGPVRVQTLPSEGAGLRGYSVSATEPVQVLRADPHRSRAVVHAVDAVIKIGGTQAEVLSPNAAKLASGAVLELLSREDLFVMADTGTAAVTVLQERWA